MEKEKQIPGILAVSHGNFAEELIKSAEMIIGKQKNVQSLALLPGKEPTDFFGEMQAALERMPEGTLILCDLFGGTPSNVSAALYASAGVHAVSGLNMPMLIEACMTRDSLRGEALANKVLAAGQGGCKDIGQAVNRLENTI